MGYIYKITNLINGKIYIGQTSKTIQERFEAHLKKARAYTNRYLYDAMNKYGYENFKVTEIEECDNANLDEREIYWIKYYNSNNKQYGYNMTIGGGGGNTWANNPHKAETARKISEHNKGKHTMPQKAIDKAREKNTIPINKEALKKDIEDFMSVEDICKKYGLTRRTFYSKCQAYFNATPTEIRGDKLTHSNSLKIELPKDILILFVKEGKSLQEMADYFSVSKETVRKRIIEIFNKPLKEVRKDVKSKN